MTKSFLHTASSYLKNCAIHLGRVAKRQERAGAAFHGVRRDSAKLVQAAKELNPQTQQHRHAARLVSQGRRCYNRKDYATAEDYFRKALDEDPDYGRALMDLGNTLYKVGRTRDALLIWKRIVANEPRSELGGQAQNKIDRVQNKEKSTLEELTRRLKGS